MKVYILIGSWGNCGDSIISVHATREGADIACIEAKSKREYDYYDIEECEVAA